MDLSSTFIIDLATSGWEKIDINIVTGAIAVDSRKTERSFQCPCRADGPRYLDGDSLVTYGHDSKHVARDDANGDVRGGAY